MSKKIDFFIAQNSITENFSRKAYLKTIQIKFVLFLKHHNNQAIRRLKYKKKAILQLLLIYYLWNASINLKTK